MESLRDTACSQCLCDSPVAVNSVNASCIRHANLVRIGVATPLASIGKPHSHRCTRRQAHQPGAEQALEINNQIKPSPTQLCPKREAIPDGVPKPTLERAAIEGECV